MTLPPDLSAQMTEWRHAFHRMPELGFDLPRTSARVADLLRGFGLEVHTGIGRSGVVGILQKGNGSRTIAIRADMDALPITEQNGFTHRSEIPGQMHACGHDGHTSMALGAAQTLAEADDLSGRIVFLFQPNEEHGQGAAAMIADGIFDRFDVETVYGMHNIPGVPVGRFATRAGPITASEALFEITIEARGGHAALPHMGADTITIGAEIVGALQTIVSRKLDPAQNGVVSVTGFETDGKRNVLPGRATLTGDARALTPEVNARIETAMRRIVDGICAAHDVTGTVSYDTIFRPTINAPEPVAAATAAAQAIGAPMDSACPPKLFSEDFAEMAATRPGCFVLMGNGTEGPHARPLHSADYDFNDAALAHGAAFWVAVARAELGP
ncbi:N-acyl-L-amino acid amidohydrolase [Roseovarius sp. THAF27]|uniref:amidohydrolase n=1 Tax=Roseovarius sp. THAF27 TaxID=2587850 RepID=UPI001268C86D|nr:amidohydrolase [Roseovarius sp. THAF27]QFT82798.1 N-acyl-L-amino acid amidohydrolase [Roseovarius sp. THAF27]